MKTPHIATQEPHITRRQRILVDFPQCLIYCVMKTYLSANWYE
ncbi:MAG: hypothetical protein KAY65_00465 [Planctomycetes bacterium]|nr:hypothetical protein [Planctomycetota bacterium]